MGADADAFTKLNVHVLNGQTKLPKIGYMLMNHVCESKLAGKNTASLTALVQRRRPQKHLTNSIRDSEGLIKDSESAWG